MGERALTVIALYVPFKKDLEPIVRPNDHVAIARSLDERSWEYYRVKYVEPLIVTETTPTVPAGGSIEFEPSRLELPSGVLGQVRIVELSSGFRLRVNHPPSTTRFMTANYVGEVDATIAANYPWLTELFYMGRDIPKFTVFNDNASDGSATIRFLGFKYILERVIAKPRDYTVIYVVTIPNPVGD